ncbi:MAG: hypothetical protein EXS03_08350 [Phycisphaerales bacterium]|nr:hypothetical protein [Phycisphaerales bacterium]
METTQPPPDSDDTLREPDPIRLLALVNVLLKHRWWIVGLTVLALTLGVVFALVASESWTSTAKFLPTQSAGIIGRMSEMVGGASIESHTDGASSSDYYIALVQSQAFLSTLAAHPFDDGPTGKRPLFEIMEAIGKTPREQTLRAAESLSKSVTIVASKTTCAPNAPRLVTLSVVAGSPTLAAAIAQEVLAQIQKHNFDVRGSKAKQNREFVAGQLKGADELLQKATDALALFSSRNRKIATPSLHAEHDKLSRAVRVQEEVFVTLMKQFELAKIEEQESREAIEIIQPPEPPLTRTSPKRTQTVLLAGFLGVFESCVGVIVIERIRSADPHSEDAKEFRSQVGRTVDDLRRLVLLGPRAK